VLFRSVMRPLNEQLAYSDEVIEHLAVQDPRVPRLRSVPCVGPVTAAPSSPRSTTRSASATRISSKPPSASCPASTAPTTRSAAVPSPKAGHSLVRWLLVHVALSILRRRSPAAGALWTWALRIAARRGTHVAVVVLARRLATLPEPVAALHA